MKKCNKPRLYLLALSVIFLAVAVSSCSKNGSGNVNASVSLKIVNAVSGSAAQDLYLNGSAYGGSGIAYGQSSSYYTVSSGSYQASFNNAGSSTANVSFTATLSSGNYYSIYYATNDTTNTAVVTQNDQTPPSSGMAKVRFINLSSAISAGVDFGLSATSKLASSLAYKAVSAYNQVSANTTFYLYAAGSANATLSIPTTVQAGKIYTIFVTGSTTLNLNYYVVAEN
jgi:hypothetical protein